jgi:hypothetical protein
MMPAIVKIMLSLSDEMFVSAREKVFHSFKEFRVGQPVSSIKSNL